MDIQYSLKNQKISPSITLAITAQAKKLKAAGEHVIEFAAGEPDFKTPEHIRAAAVDAIRGGNIGYTAAAGLPELRKAICQKLKRDNGLQYEPENIVVSNGAKHSLFNAFSAVLNPGDEVIIPVPYWVSYPRLVELADGVPVMVETSQNDGFKYNLEILARSITGKTRAILLNSPGNPTGVVYTKNELKAIADLAVEKKVMVISDEIYEKLVYGCSHESIAAIGNEIKDLTIVINGMSKCYAMTGWRIGYTASNKPIADIMTNIQSHATSNANTIAQYASIAGLSSGSESIDEMVKEFHKRKNHMVGRIQSIAPLSCIDPNGAFYVMVNISQVFGKKHGGRAVENSLDFADLILQKEKVALIPGIAFGTDQYVRLSYATSFENIEEGLNRIEKFISELK